jgi:hypothetical protein
MQCVHSSKLDLDTNVPMKEHICDHNNTSEHQALSPFPLPTFECLNAPAHLLYAPCFMYITSIFLHVVESFRSTLRLPPISIFRPLPELRGAPQLVISLGVVWVKDNCLDQLGMMVEGL